MLANLYQATNSEGIYLVGSCSVPVCDNISIQRCRINRSEALRGKIASKRGYFYGLKVYLLVPQTGKPDEILLTPDGDNGLTGNKALHMDVPEQSELEPTAPTMTIAGKTYCTKPWTWS
jgi:hypothetical protein